MTILKERPNFILFAQHGWADTNRSIGQLAKNLATPNTLIIAPNLGYFRTWLRIEPLIDRVETIAIETISKYPDTPIRIIGHSMGGLIWLELLDRHPEWHERIHSLVLVASPVGGADLARIFDPLGIGIGIAADLGKNRRQIAESIAKLIPTLVIAGDVDDGSDGTIPIEATKFFHSQFICLPNISHPALKNNSSLVEIINNFWANISLIINSELNSIDRLIQRLRSIPGITDAHYRNFYRSQKYIDLPNNLTIHTSKNFWQIPHVFLSNSENKCLYAGFVGWQHAQILWENLEKIKYEYC